MPAPTTILLDLDGTLADPFEGISASVRHALELLGLPVPDDPALRDWIGPPLAKQFADYLDSMGADADPASAVAAYRARYADSGQFENRVYDGIPELLEALNARGHAMILATSKPRVFAQSICAYLGLDQHLSALHGSELDGRRANKAELLAFLLHAEGLHASRCVMVGDRRHDMDAARRHGIPGIGVLWGYGSETELREAGARWTISDPQQVLAILDGIAED